MTSTDALPFDLDGARAQIEAADLTMFGGPRPLLRRTPLWKLPGAALGVDCREVWLKLEHLQVSGSFKARGMLWRLMASAATPSAGAVIASGGNAGIACAQAAAHLGLPCEVFVPEVCPQAKRDRLAALGARVTVQGARYPQALEACLARQRETGAVLVHAYDQPEVVIGAGTLALEIEAQGGRAPDATLVSVGGGGLVAGLAAGFGVRGRVVALEPELAPTLAQARADGRPVDVEVGGVAVDSLGARRIGAIAWAVTQRLVDEVLTLSDEAIRQAQREMWRELRLGVEPAAALPLAALRSGVWRPRPDDAVCLIVCGANVDPGTL
jgi:threonine dehydratase